MKAKRFQRWQPLTVVAAAVLVLFGAALRTWAELAPQIIWQTQSSTISARSPLVEGEDGMFYGTFPGNSSGGGSLFRLTSAGDYTQLVSFAGSKGDTPEAGLLLANDGNFYGTTAFGGTSNQGTIFRFSPGSGLQTLHSFTTADGAVMPMYSLIQAADGLLYGVSLGNVPKVFCSTTQGAVTALTNTPYGSSQLLPNDGLVQGPDGWLYGTVGAQSAWVGGLDATMGAIFKISTNGQIQMLAVFTRTAQLPVGWPMGGLTPGTDGYLYGVLSGAGRTNFGRIFRMSTTGQITTVANFNGTNGSNPTTRLLLASDGSFYGATVTNVFRVTTDGELTRLPAFAGTNIPGNKGSSLIQARSGCLYGIGANLASTNAPILFSPFVYRYVDPPVLSVGAAPGTGVTLSWNSFTDAVYQVQYKSNIDDVSWTPFSPNVSAAGTNTSFYDDAGGAGKRFYEIVLLP